MQVVRQTALALVVLTAASCGTSPPRVTVRLVGGKPEVTRYVSPGAYAHYLRTRIALHRGELSNALRHIRAAIAFDGGSPILHTTLARILARLDQQQEAESALADALALVPGFPDALILRAKLLERRGRIAEARQALAECVRANPQSEEAYLQHAALLVRTGEAQRATQMLRALVLRMPSRAGEKALGELCLRELELTCASEHFERALSLATDPSLLMRLADVYRAVGEPRRAIALLREAFDRTGGDPLVSRVLLRELVQSKEPAEVSDRLLMLGRDAADDPARLAQVAALALELKLPALALKIVDDAATEQLHHPRLEVVRGLAQTRLGQVKQGLALIQRQLDGEAGSFAVRALHEYYQRERAPRQASLVLAKWLESHGPDPAITALLSRSLTTEGRGAAAVSLLQQELTKSPQDRGLSFALAVALEQTGAWQAALQLMRTLTARDDKDPGAENFIGYVLADRATQLDEAERHLRRAHFLDPGASYVIDSLGWLYFRKGQQARALELLSMAERLSPDDAEVLGHLAEVRVALSQFTLAIRTLERALSVSDDPKLSQRLELRLKQLTRPRVGTR